MYKSYKFNILRKRLYSFAIDILLISAIKSIVYLKGIAVIIIFSIIEIVTFKIETKIPNALNPS